MKNIIIIIFLFNSFFSYTQESNLILTEKENTLWLENFNKIENKTERIDFIIERLRNDKNIYIEWSFPDGITVERIPVLDSLRKVRVKGYCKPLFAVKYKSENLVFRFENPINDRKINSVIELLNTENIKNVELETYEKNVLYGISGECGIIIIETTKREIFREFKKMKLTSIYMDEIMTYGKN